MKNTNFWTGDGLSYKMDIDGNATEIKRRSYYYETRSTATAVDIYSDGTTLFTKNHKICKRNKTHQAIIEHFQLGYQK